MASVPAAFLARRIRCSENTVYNYLADKTLPDLKTVNLIRKEFDYEPLTKLPEIKKTIKTKPKVKITKVDKSTYKVESKAARKPVKAKTQKQKTVKKNVLLAKEPESSWYSDATSGSVTVKVGRKGIDI